MDAVSHIQEMAEVDLNDPLFRTDAFMVYGFKVLPCRRTRRHDWRECPFAHPGEVARRRDPRLYTYVGIICPDAKQSAPCPRGDHCPYTHSLFEYWLHPTRYKTEFCSRGRQCTRPFCFFAHSETEVRPVDTDALLAVAMTPQMVESSIGAFPPSLLQGQQQHQQQPTSTLSVSEAVAQTADLLQKTNILQQYPVHSMDQSAELSYLKSIATPGMTCFTPSALPPLSSAIHSAEWVNQPQSPISTQLPLIHNNQMIQEHLDANWEDARRFQEPNIKIQQSPPLPPLSAAVAAITSPRMTSTDELLSKLGLSYLQQSAQRSHSHDISPALVIQNNFVNNNQKSANDENADFGAHVIPLDGAESVLVHANGGHLDNRGQVVGRSCKSFDSVLFQTTKPNHSYETVSPGEVAVTRGRSLPNSIQLSPKEHPLYK